MNKNNSKQKQKKNGKRVGAIVGLSIALSFALAAAVTLPLVVKKPGSDPTTVTYSVTFVTGSGAPSVSPTKVLKGEKVNQPYVDIWEKSDGKYQVTSWKNGNEVYDFSKPVTSDITLTAQWEKLPPSTVVHTVLFKEADSETIYQREQIVDGLNAIKPTNPSKSGYIFKYWRDKDKSVEFDFTTPILKDTTLVAEWEQATVITHTITFHAGNGGTFDDGSAERTGTCNDNDYFIGISKPTITNKSGYTHIGWMDKDGNDISATKITSDIDAYAKYSVEEKYVKLSLDSTPYVPNPEEYKIEIKGQNEYSWKQDDHKTYSSIKKGLPVATCIKPDDTTWTYTFKNWSLTKQTKFSTINPEPGDSVEISDNDVLYPQFAENAQIQTLTLNVQLTTDQTIKSGSTTIEVPFQVGSTPKKFKEINKPEVFENGKVFDDYYEDAEYKNKWNPEAELTQTYVSSHNTIYIHMVTPVSEPEVTFSVEDTAAELAKYKWVGNHSNIKVAANTPLSNIAVPNVYYKDAKENPDPTIGFSTDYYFTKWYYKKGDEKVYVGNGYKITNSITLYAEFEQKTEVVIETNEETTPSTTTIKAIPATKWKDIVKPDVTTSSTTTRFLTGWCYVEDGTTINLDDDTTIESIPLSSAEGQPKVTIHIKPVISDKVHTIEFDTTPNDPSGKITSVWYKGNTKIGVDMTKETNVNNGVNKPALPKYDEVSKTKQNQGFTFDNKWQIQGGDFGKIGSDDWTDVTEKIVIPAAANPVEYKMRPVITANITITFNKGSDGEFASGAITSLSVGPESKFSEMYKPEVVANSGKTFSHWATKVQDKEEYIQVTPTSTFDKDTTLYAIYSTDDVQSIINFKVAESDIKDTAFPAQPINEDNLFVSAKTHKPSEDVKVKDFAYIVPTKKKHTFSGWGIYNSQGALEAVDSETVVAPGTPLTLYAMFTPNASKYHKVTIKEDPDNYTVVGMKTFYVADEDTMPINLSNEIATDETTYAWTEGKNLTGWKTSDGTVITNATKVTSDMLDIVPVFTAPEVQPLVNFAIVKPGETEPTGSLISDRGPHEIPVNSLLSPYLTTVWAPTVSKPKSQHTGWKILDKDGETLIDITDKTRVTNDMLTDGKMTLVATFIDESIFEGIDGAYFYDTSVSMWAAIQSYNSQAYGTNFLKVQYQDGTTALLPKESFDYEIKFGSQTTKIPDYFMYGCNNWNNGGKELKFPDSTISIGKNVMYGCTSFNQPITLNVKDPNDSLPIGEGDYSNNRSFIIGENFMKNCYSFDSNLTLTFNGTPKYSDKYYLVVSQGFMQECHTLGLKNSEIDFSGWDSIGLVDPIVGTIGYVDGTATSLTSADFETCLSVTMDDPHIILIKVSKDNTSRGTTPYTYFTKALPPMPSGLYHRAISIYN